MQLLFALFVVINLWENLRPQKYIHAGHTKKAHNGFTVVRFFICRLIWGLVQTECSVSLSDFADCFSDCLKDLVDV